MPSHDSGAAGGFCDKCGEAWILENPCQEVAAQMREIQEEYNDTMWTIELTEHVYHGGEVRAKDEEEAREKARDMYANNELDGGDEADLDIKVRRI